MHVPGLFSLPHLPNIPLGYFIININPILVQIGNLAIHWYGVMYVVAIVIGMFVLRRWCPKMGIHEDQLYGLFIWSAIGGLIGGRLYFVIQQPDLVDRYLKQPANILAVWNGGMAFFGAIFLGTATLFVLAPRYGLDRWLAIDGGAVFALVGQIFGRVGNVINGDILGQQASAGLVSVPGSTCANAPCIAYVSDPSVQPAWSFVYLHPGSLAQTGIAFQPAPIYEMLINVVMLLLLFPLRYRLPRIKTGYFFVAYLALYAVGQFIVFFWRGTEPYTPFLGIHAQLKQAQWTALVVLLLCIPLFFLVSRVSAPWLYSAKKPVPWPPAGAAKKPSVEGVEQPPIFEPPPWEPTRTTGGALRNILSPPRAPDDSGTES